ncbi:hypothetical protein [Candidatus Enterovibrio escicola]|uniref:hypothetical protein n=1 Tax=Candidatus Enterovibrio escicola TaxID=1927127 RepID=UPI001680EDEE|nr:hypothetical protein [Candidatus Enterovibrio escacola]
MFNEFEIEDVIQITGDDTLYMVSGVIHDNEYVYFMDTEGNEDKVQFKDVSQRWVKTI